MRAVNRSGSQTIKRLALQLLITTLVVLGVSFFGASFTSEENAVFSPLWPASGIAFALVLLWGFWMLPGVYFGTVFCNLMLGTPMPFAWIGPFGTVFEAAAAVGLMVLVLGPRPRITDLRSCLAFLFIAPWMPVILNGLYCFILLKGDMLFTYEQLIREVGVFILANGMGIALFAPPFAVWTSKPDADWWKRMGLVGSFCLLASAVVLGLTSKVTAYLLLLPLIAAAVYVGLRGTATLVAGVALIAYLTASMDVGYFSQSSSLVDKFWNIYLFLGLASVCALPIAAVVGQYRVRLRRVSLGTEAAGLTVWSWSDKLGLTIERHLDHFILSSRKGAGLDPSLFFDSETNHGSRETEIAGRKVLTVWLVGRRRPDGTPRDVSGVLLDMSERLSVEQARHDAWLSKIELRNLRASLAPHMIFNCLAALRGIIRTDPESARTFIDHLAEFLRETNGAQSQQTISLRDEWRMCEDYLHLQAMRQERDLPRTVEIEGAAWSAEIPPMILLSIIDNALKHGRVEPGCPLSVSARIKNSRLHIVVRNHGALGPMSTSRTGGISVSSARLYTIYRHNAAIDMRQEDDQVCASLQLPTQPPPPPACP